MPSFPKLYKKQKESYSFDLYIYLKKKQSKDVVFYLIGVHPDYQNKAVTAVIFSEYYHTFKARWKTVSVHLNLLTTRQFIIYGNISIQKLIAEENFQDRALTKCSVLSPKQHCFK
jgi:hypothetical protein